MTDTYAQLVNHGLGRTVARKLGLPRPATLRRYSPGEPLITGPVLVHGSTAGAESLASALSTWGLDVRQQAGTGEAPGAIIVVLDEVEHPDGLADPILAAAASLRDLAPAGRIITLSRPASLAESPASAAARQGVEGFLRSVAKELRAGATANGILLGNGVEAGSNSVLGAVGFFLSGRSAFVDGQLLTVSTPGTGLPGPDKPLSGRVAVVTGAARGIGAAIARTLHRDGAGLVLVDVPASGEQLAAVANEVRGTALQLDISRQDAGNRILNCAIQRHQRLDIMVHNAGITRDKLLVNMDGSRWQAVMDINLSAQLRINQVLLASERFRESPRIVSVASTSGIAGNRGQTNYAASKAGVMGMVRATAPLLAARGGSINAVAPGFIETDMTARMPFALREMGRRLNSLQQGGLPIDVAESIAFLAGDAASGINGEVLRVCGQNVVGA